MRAHSSLALSLALAVLAASGCGGSDADPSDSAPGAGNSQPGKAPNIVVVMTDDQAMDTMEAMPKTTRIFGKRGTDFEASVASFPLCCPSRATFLTGMYAHNHGVIDNNEPAGSLSKLDQKETLPVWLGRAGYRTAFIGKYLNGYGREDLGGPEYVPPGWDSWFALTLGTKKQAFGFEVNEDGELWSVGRGSRDYRTDVLARAAAREIADAAKRKAPLFLWVATSAPHADPDLEGADRNPEPAPRYRGKFEDAEFDPGPAFNERDVTDKPGFVRKLPRLGPKAREQVELTYVSQLESLLGVDDLVARVVAQLRRTGELENTIVVFTSDNGFLRGQHRIDSGKAKIYEESIRVPLLVMGPGFPSGETVASPVANVDLAPTFLEAAGAEAPVEMDGIALFDALGPEGDDRAVLLEVFARKADQFVGLRTDRWTYAERQGDIAELYDLEEDPFQLENLAADPRFADVREELRERLDELRDCAGEDCA